MRKIKNKEISVIKAELLAKQDYVCSICETDLSNSLPINICLDHCHTTGVIRSVLCRNCNAIEGKIFNLCTRGKRDLGRYDFLNNIISYWIVHSEPMTNLIHPKHKTKDEKRIIRNKKAKIKRDKLKGK